MDTDEILYRIEQMYHYTVNSDKINVPRTCIMSLNIFSKIGMQTYLFMDLYYSDLIEDDKVYISDTQILSFAPHQSYRKISDSAALKIINEFNK